MAGALKVGRRLRARAGVEESVALKLKSELEAIGAIVSLKARDPGPGAKAPEPEPEPEPRDGSRVPSSSARGREPGGLFREPGPGTRAGEPEAGGLSREPGSGARAPEPEAAVAFSEVGLGALAGPPERLFLSTLDGDQTDSQPAAPLSAAALPPPPPPPPVAPATESPPQDPFAPDQAGEEAIELATRPPRTGTVAAAPREAPAAPAPPAAHAPSEPYPPAEAAPEPEARRFRLPAARELAGLALREPRARFALGLALGLAIGFVCADIYGSFAEDKLDDIRAELARQPAPESEAEYDLALQQYDLARERMGRVRIRIAVVSGVVWVLAGGAVAAAFWRFAPGAQSYPGS